MQNKIRSIKNSNQYFPKLISQKKRITYSNFFTNKNPSSSKYRRIIKISKTASINSFDNINSSTSIQLYSLKSPNIKNNKNKQGITTYSYKKNDFFKDSRFTSKNLFSNELINKFLKIDLNKNLTDKLKITCGVDTKDLLYKTKQKFQYRPLTSKKIIKKYNYNNLNENNQIYFVPRKKNKITKSKLNLKENIYELIKKDKYAYIYLSDNSESIKYSRRVNYNPLDV
jgi:hypothetical protein